MSEPARSTARPDGWVGDPAQLEKARRYRAFIKWGAIPFYVLLAAYWILMLMGSAIQWLLLPVIVVWIAADFVLQRRVGTIIGRKWSTWQEYKERKRQDDPWQRGEEEESNPVAGWMESADSSPGSGSSMATNPTEPPRDPWWIRSPTWLLFGLFFVAVSTVVVVVVLAVADVAGGAAGTTVPDDVALASASTTTLPADVTVDTEPADVTVDTTTPISPSSTIATIGTAILVLPDIEELDILFANRDQRNNGCFGYGSGAVTCSDVSSDANKTRGVALGDIDGDGNLDAVFANRGQRNGVCSGNGLGRITCSDVSSDANDTLGVALGDIDGDGDLDAVFAGTGRNRLCIGNGTRRLACRDISLDTNDTLGVALGDMDGDGILDAVFANVTDSTVEGDSNRLCLGDGSGGFVCSDVSSDANITRGVALGNVDGAGKPIVVFANFGQRNRLCSGDGSGRSTCSDISSDTNDTLGVALGDIDGDGDLDAVFANSRQPNRVCLATATGVFAPCFDISSDTNDTLGVALGDIDGDGNLDAVFANSRQPNRMCMGDKSGDFVCNPVSDESNDSAGVAVPPAR
jgi:hypothetical protein